MFMWILIGAMAVVGAVGSANYRNQSGFCEQANDFRAAAHEANLSEAKKEKSKLPLAAEDGPEQPESATRKKHPGSGLGHGRVIDHQ